MSKRKRDPCSPLDTSMSFNDIQQSTPKNQQRMKSVPKNIFNVYSNKVVKSNSTNSISAHYTSAGYTVSNALGINLTSNNQHQQMQSSSMSNISSHDMSAFSNKSVHTSSSSSSIESTLSMMVPGSSSSSEESLPDVNTPNNSFKFVKPLQTVFNSSGLVSKKKSKNLQSPMVFNQNGILIEKKSNLSFPDTPCKSFNSENCSPADGNLISYSKKSARQLLAEFKANKSTSDIDIEDSLLFGKTSRALSKNTKNITLSIKNSPLSYDPSSPLARETFDDADFQSPLHSKFGSKLKHEHVPLITTSKDNASAAQPPLPMSSSATVGSGLHLQINSNSANNSSKFSSLNTPTTPVFTDPDSSDLNPFLSTRFNKEIKLVHKGDFSKVYQVTYQKSIYAIKELNGFIAKKATKLNTELNNDAISKHLSIKKNSKKCHNDEIEVLNLIKVEQHKLQRQQKQQSERKIENARHVMTYIDFFQFDEHDYIISPYYGKGSLDQFLLNDGINTKLDEFRVWKMLLEISKGLKFIHDLNILHLDIKPANIFIEEDGRLVIGDFGLSAHLKETQVFSGDKEGDREYIAPEILSKSIYDKRSDIFSLGLIIVEIAANIFLPHNGVSWQKLRNGDLSDAGVLSSCVTVEEKENLRDLKFLNDGKTLDLLIHWMIEPNYENRPMAQDILQLAELATINFVRKKPATLYEPEFDKEHAQQMMNQIDEKIVVEEMKDMCEEIEIEEEFDVTQYASVHEMYHLGKFSS